MLANVTHSARITTHLNFITRGWNFNPFSEKTKIVPSSERLQSSGNRVPIFRHARHFQSFTTAHRMNCKPVLTDNNG